VLVACWTVSVHLKSTVLPTEVTGHALLSSLSWAKRGMPPWQLRCPFWPSTLCGS
jgi:hypothetical protein